MTHDQHTQDHREQAEARREKRTSLLRLQSDMFRKGDLLRKQEKMLRGERKEDPKQ